MTKVLILGGGLGGMSAAWALSRTPALRAQFDVTVIQPGWRLGGKCASGREAATGRIHEHGLHMFMGWYEQAFYMLREVYTFQQTSMANPASRLFPHAGDAFLPLRDLCFGRPGTLDFWSLTFPVRPGKPGDDPNERHVDVLGLAVQLARGIHNHLGLVNLPFPPNATIAVALTMLDSIGSALATAILAPKKAHEARVLVGLGLAALRGMIAADIPTWGVQVINHLDFREWLTAHGASREVTDCALVKALYDLAFAYPDGDETKPGMEAGSMLLTVLRMGADYEDAPVYRMRAGMGDVVFAPLYEVLSARGVKFDFFRRCKGIELTADDKRVEKVTLQRQVDLVIGNPVYKPLINCPVGGKDLWCWPDEPDWTQIQGPPVNPKTLELGGAEVGVDVLKLGVDFDEVILAIPLGGDLAATLAAASPAWDTMRKTMQTVSTQSVQLWTLPAVAALGWTHGETVLAGFVPPFSAWADMSHLLPVEAAVVPSAAQGLIYLCGVTPDLPPYAHVPDGLSDWLDAHGRSIWPAAAEPAGFRYVLLEGGSLTDQYVRVNSEGSERYVLSVPGSTATRIEPGNTGFLNLSVAGDWVRGAINGGCAEAAVQGGHAAADALILRITGTARPPYPPVL